MISGTGGRGASASRAQTDSESVAAMDEIAEDPRRSRSRSNAIMSRSAREIRVAPECRHDVMTHRDSREPMRSRLPKRGSYSEA